MKLINLITIVLALLLWSCGGESADSTDTASSDSSQVSEENNEENTEEIPESEETETSGESSLNMADDVAARSLVGKWVLDWDEEGDPYLSRDFLPEFEYVAEAVGLRMTGTYTVENGFLIVEATVDEGYSMAREKIQEKIKIVEITEEMPYQIKLKDAEGKILVYNLKESYGD